MAKVDAVLLLVNILPAVGGKVDAVLLLMNILPAGGGEGGCSVAISEYISRPLLVMVPLSVWRGEWGRGVGVKINPIAHGLLSIQGLGFKT